MTAIEIVKNIMTESNISLGELTDYVDLGSKSNVHHLLNLRKDLKVGTFVELLEAMGYQLIVQSTETEDDEIIVDYD